MLRFYEPLGLEYERAAKGKNPILGFSKEHRFLSNFYVRDVEMHDLIFPSSEHAFMWHKSENEDYRRQILEAYSPAKAKALGKNQRLEALGLLRDDWRDPQVRIRVMYDVLKAKFSDITLWVMLQATQNRYLEETNYWNDVFWGRCRSEGENHLGRLLMCIRYETRRTDKSRK